MKELNPNNIIYPKEVPKLLHKRVSSSIDLRITDYSKLNAREKKIVEDFPKTTKDELEKLSNQMRNQDMSRNTDIN